MPLVISRTTSTMYTVKCPHCRKYDGATVKIVTDSKGEIVSIEVDCSRAPDGRQDRT